MASALDLDTVTTTRFRLNNGNSMPAVGFGTYRIRCGETIMKVVDEALSAGYRMFDTASVYHNELLLNAAFKELLPKHELEREDIFVTTKLSPYDHKETELIEKAYKQSIENLGLEYVDLYLIHFPGTAKLACDDKRNIEIRNSIWASLVHLYDNGQVNAIGVSNFTEKHLQQILKNNHGVIPVVNQVEWHPYYYQTELLDYCKANEITLQAYCSFGGASSNDSTLIKHPSVTKIARKLEVTNAQVLLRWALQQDISVIPKSTDPKHIRENICLNFKIPEEDMRILNNLSSQKIKYAWDPSNVA